MFLYRKLRPIREQQLCAARGEEIYCCAIRSRAENALCSFFFIIGMVWEGGHMELKSVTDRDKEFVMGLDQHVDDRGYANRVYTKFGYVIWEGNRRVGVLSHCILWDKVPFMNFLFVDEEYRRKGLAGQAVLSLENEMKNQGYQMVLISTQADEGAQHLYRKLGYIDCGGLVFHNTPFDQPLELFFRKVL